MTSLRIQLMGEDEEALVRLAQLGDLDAFEALARRLQDRAFRTAYRLLGSREEAEDAVQESLIRLFQSIHRYEARTRFSAWFLRIVANVAIDMSRARKRAPVELHTEPGVPGHETQSDLRLSLSAAMKRLSPKQRAAFVLRYLEGFTMSEVAAALDCSQVTARVHLHGARRRLRDFLEDAP